MKRPLSENPICNVEWMPAESLKANDYNPNYVFKPEMNLLELSLIKQGWIQPIMVTQDLVIIDGYHRTWLAINSPAVRDLTDGNVPVCRLNLSEPERMFLTIRLNRAKGHHIALKMHEVVYQLNMVFGIPKEKIAQEIGATKDEIDLLLQENVFKSMNTKDHKYSKAWYPKRT